MSEFRVCCPKIHVIVNRRLDMSTGEISPSLSLPKGRKQVCKCKMDHTDSCIPFRRVSNINYENNFGNGKEQGIRSYFFPLCLGPFLNMSLFVKDAI